MRQNMLEAYEQGYLDGLREAHAELIDSPLPQAPNQEESSQSEVLCHPGYRAGFSEGLRDGTEVLRELGKTSRPRQV